ncbi:hypothetical protein YC2023_049101 [Brassica napus]
MLKFLRLQLPRSICLLKLDGYVQPPPRSFPNQTVSVLLWLLHKRDSLIHYTISTKMILIHTIIID